MTIEENGTTSTSGTSSSSPVSYNITESYNTVYVSSSTYKVSISLAVTGQNLLYTAWVLKNGTALAVDVGGSNVTGAGAQGTVSAAFVGFAVEALAGATIGSYATSNYSHSTGGSTIMIGPTQVAVTAYAANTLPETVNSCGASVTLTAFSLSVGTPQGTNSSLITYERIAGSETEDGQTTTIDLVLRLTSIALASVSTSTSTSSSSSTWFGGPAYPLQVSGKSGVGLQSCVNGTATIYCIGGIGYEGVFVSNVYSASVSSSGMTGWTADTSYPQPIAEQSCVSYQSDVYCVGGSYNDAEDDIASSYFAPLNGTGIGSWVSTTSYPVPIGGQSCVSSSGYIYCVGGENETDGTNATLAQSNSDWYAQLSSSGIGVWKQTTSYPQGTDYASCAATSTMVYCIGGQDASGNGVDNVYFAPISSSGIGAWSGSTAYPIKVGGQSCVTDSGSIICVGGLTNVSASGTGIDAVYSATILAGGVGSWQQDSSFPVDAETLCTLVTGNLYCTGGYQNGSSASEIWSDFTYYASVQSQLE